MKKILFVTLIIIVILISLSMDCFKGTERRIDFSYDPEKAGADLISKTDLSKYVDSCNNVGIDFKDNKLYLASDKKVFQFNSNNLTLENAYNISLDVTYDYNITSITHDDNYFYILANEYDQTGDIIKQHILKEIAIGNKLEIYHYFTNNNNNIIRVKCDPYNNLFLSLYFISNYYYGDDDHIITKYFMFYINYNNKNIELTRVGIDYNLERKGLQSFCYNHNDILSSYWENHDEIGITGSIDIYNSNNYYTVWNTKPSYTINTSYLGDDDFVCIYDMVFDGTYLWCLVNDDDKDAWITGGGTPYLLKLKPRW